MTAPLIFVVAPTAYLPTATTSSAALEAVQARGPATGFSLRIFNRGREHADLGQLPLDGSLTGDQRRSSDGTQLLCDALVPRIEPSLHGLGIYRADGQQADQCHCLDHFSLNEASNATCWFYPTHDGTYLSWERGINLTLAPGRVADCPPDLLSAPYDRSRIAVLWSLLGDDASLTCVGITYGGQRIDWPVRALTPEPVATWGRFRVDSQADTTLVVEDCLSVFAEPPAHP
jgi:hypothetical protein